MREYLLRLHTLYSNRWHNLEALMEFNQEHRVPCTFFIACSKGRSLCYPKEQASKWIHRVESAGFSVGLHGISLDSVTEMETEYDWFARSAASLDFGIRFHDIGIRPKDAKLTRDGMLALARLGYAFSSNTFEWRNPERIEGILDFPIHIMDSALFTSGSRWFILKASDAIERTKILFERAREYGISYFQILFHDVYFSDAYKNMKEWYIWLVGYLQDQGITLVNFNSALREIDPKAARRLESCTQLNQSQPSRSGSSSLANRCL